MNNITFGLTGGIAVGKSRVTTTFRKYDIPIIDADIIARQVVELGSKGLKQIAECFGKSFLIEDGTLDRVKLGKLVFSDAGALKEINSIMGILIQEESAKQIAAAHRDGNYLVGYDAALICEMGHADNYRPLIVVSCPQDTQCERLMSRNSLTRPEAMARINSQMPVSEKVKLADFVIDSSGTIEHSIEQTEFIIGELKIEAKL